jgi:hypothetical protein
MPGLSPMDLTFQHRTTQNSLLSGEIQEIEKSLKLLALGQELILLSAEERWVMLMGGLTIRRWRKRLSKKFRILVQNVDRVPQSDLVDIDIIIELARDRFSESLDLYGDMIFSRFYKAELQAMLKLYDEVQPKIVAKAYPNLEIPPSPERVKEVYKAFAPWRKVDQEVGGH